MIDDDQREAMRQAIMDGAAYRLAQEDLDFLAEEDLRPLRLQLELFKPELALRKHDIRSTVVVFGSARLTSPKEAQAHLTQVQAQQTQQPDDQALKAALTRAKQRLAYSCYYDEARRFAQIVSYQFQHRDRRDFVVVTGGGPGIMEAANRGAFDARAHSIGLNITLQHEQAPNPFITPELAFRFHYFAIRKMHFLMRAKALVVFPGGYGTLDELFEVLTLVQTFKMPRIPIVLFGSEFWHRLIDFDYLVEQGMIDEADAKLFTFVEKAEDAVAVLKAFYHGKPP